MDLEKQPPTIVHTVSGSSSISSDHALTVKQTGISNVRAPQVTYESPYYSRSLHHKIFTEAQSAKIWYHTIASIIYILVVGQVVLSLAIVLGCQKQMDLSTITVLAGVNTGLAVGNGMTMGFGFPERKEDLGCTLREFAA